MQGHREGKDVRTMDRGEGHGIGNGLDRGRADIVDDDRATRMKNDNHNGHDNRETTITHSIRCSSRTLIIQQ